MTNVFLGEPMKTAETSMYSAAIAREAELRRAGKNQACVSKLLQECIAAIASSAVLTFLTDGIFYNPQEDKFYLKESVLPMAKQTVAEIEAS